MKKALSALCFVAAIVVLVVGIGYQHRHNRHAEAAQKFGALCWKSDVPATANPYVGGDYIYAGHWLVGWVSAKYEEE